MAKRSKNVHYVNNSEFSLAIVEYVKSVNAAKEQGEELPIVPDYIAMCFLKIAENEPRESPYKKTSHAL